MEITTSKCAYLKPKGVVMARTSVEFSFSIDQKVKTVFGDVGIVKSLSLDDTACKKVYVMRSNDSAWFKEEELTATE
jgi:hypothetical protein